MAKKKRSSWDIQVFMPPEMAGAVIADFMSKEGFSYIQHKKTGEPVWYKDMGAIEGPQYIKIEQMGAMAHIEAWITGSFGGEMSLEGFVGALPKSMMKSKVESLIVQLSQQVVMQPVPGQPMQYPQAVPQLQAYDPKSKSVWSLVSGLGGIVAGLIIPLAGIILASLSIGFSGPGRKSSQKGLAVTGLVLGIIAMAVSIANWILAAINIGSGGKLF